MCVDACVQARVYMRKFGGVKENVMCCVVSCDVRQEIVKKRERERVRFLLYPLICVLYRMQFTGTEL